MARVNNLTLVIILGKREIASIMNQLFGPISQCVRIVINGAKKGYLLEANLEDPSQENATVDAEKVYQSRSGDYINV
jgi:hypothetical protein